jgi:hypothetical protein
MNGALARKAMNAGRLHALSHVEYICFTLLITQRLNIVVKAI